MNKELLLKILNKQSSYNDDTNINNFITNYIENDLNLKYEKDLFGNIYITKGKGPYKTIVCHTDTVHDIHDKYKVIEFENNLMAIKLNKDTNLLQQTGIGGDDKCGIYTCLQSLHDFNDIKVVFFRFEESGCRGSNACNISFFKDCNFVIQCDRKGNSDYITYTNGLSIASHKFETDLKPIFEKYKYKKERGTSTDVGCLVKRGINISALNLSSGYWNPHTDFETINLDDLDCCYNLVSEIFKKYGNIKYEHTPVIFQPTTNHTYNTKPKIHFSNNKNFSFFINRSYNKEIDLSLLNNNSYLFEKIKRTNYYKYLKPNDQIQIFTQNQKYRNFSIFFDIKEATFIKESIKDSTIEFIEDDSLFEDLFIADKDKVFVYDWLANKWLCLENAIWNTKYMTWSYIK